MAFQFNIYPTGAITSYVNKVNNTLGVCGILDRQMGINENSMSGVAFYIRNIEDFVNLHNVGTSVNDVVSGYFNYLGYFTQNKTHPDYPFVGSADSVLTPITQMYVKSLTLDCSSVYAQSITASGATMNNVIFEGSIFGEEEGKYFDNVVVSGGIISNLYSGYYHAFADPIDIFNSSGVPVDFNNPRTLDYSVPAVGGNTVLGDITTRRRLSKPMYEYGIKQGRLLAEDMLISSGTIISSGNINVFRELKIDLASIATTKYVAESVMSFDSHNHDGVNSRRIQASGLASTEPPTDEFTVTLQSGNFVVDGVLAGNGIGLKTDWDSALVAGVDDAQSLLTSNGVMYIVDTRKLTAVGRNVTRTAPIDIIGYTSVSSSPNGMGDSVGYAYFGSRDSSGQINNDIYLDVIDGSSDVEYKTQVPIDGFSINGNFDEVNYRRTNNIDSFNRINDKIYFSLWEQFTAGTANQCLSLYSLVPEDMRVQLVATAGDIGAGWSGGSFMSPFTIGYNLVLPYRNPSGSPDMETLVYNPVYRPKKQSYESIGGTFTYQNQEFSSSQYEEFNWFVSGAQRISLTDTGNYNLRYDSDYAYFDGSVYYLAEHDIFRVDMLKRNMPRFSDLSWSGDISVVAYAGRLWTGTCLQRAYNRDGIKEDYSQFADKIYKLTGNADPWLCSPVVHDGWLYAIAPVIPYTTWKNKSFTDKFNVDYTLPKGSLIVRRKDAEVELSENLYPYTV